ncbi:MAG TPA: ATP-binding protein [Stellaceae bacterium]|nr:ATP-binding protein [Stellaceae bacterium]
MRATAKTVGKATATPDLSSVPVAGQSPMAVQPHGAVLVFERPGYRLAQASETLPRFLPRELHASLGAPVETLFDAEIAVALRALPPNAEDVRLISVQGRVLDLRLLAADESVVVEIEPIDERVDAADLGTMLDDVTVSLGQAANLSDIARTSCTRLASILGFSVVALARNISDEQIQILAEINDGTLPSLAGRPDSARLLCRFGAAERLTFVADTLATPVRVVSAPGLPVPTSALHGVELTQPPPLALGFAAVDGVRALAVVPILVDGRAWGWFVLEHGIARRCGHQARRFAHALAQVAGAAVKRVLHNTRERAEQLASEAVGAFEAAIAGGATPLDGLLFGEQLLATTAGAEGVVVLCGQEYAIVGDAPDADALVLRLPRLLTDTDASIATDRLLEAGDFTHSELAGVRSMLAICLARSPFIAVAAFRGGAWPGGDPALEAWEPLRIDAFLSLARAFRRTLLLGDEAAGVELSSQLEEFDARAFGSGILRSAILSSSTAGMALMLGRGGSRLEIVEFNPMFRRFFGLDRREPVAGTAEELGERLGIAPALLLDCGRPAGEIELWSSELGTRIVEFDTRSIVRTRVGGAIRELTLLQIADVTRIRRQEVAMRIARDQALALIRSRDELLANMSHELRTPLNAVIGFADMISQETFGPIGNERYAGYGRDIETAGRHLLALINDVLDLSRIAAGRQLVEDAAVNLSEIVASCVSWARAASRKRSVKLKIDTGGEALSVRCDERAIRQVLINLISNAVKFTPDDGGVRVELAWRPHGNVVIEVADNGIGMTPHELSRAFDPFFRGGGAYRRRIEGAGLGLSIARGLIELHAGTLTLDSIEGKGTTAKIELPGWRVLPREP